MSKAKQMIEEVLKGSDPKNMIEAKNPLPLADHLARFLDPLTDLGYGAGMNARGAQGASYKAVETLIASAVDQIEKAMKIAKSKNLFV